MKWGPDMFGNTDKRARKKAMKSFKKERRDIFEGLDNEGRGNIQKALIGRLQELKKRNESDISAKFRNSPFVKQRVEQFAIAIEDKRKRMEKQVSQALQKHIDTETGRYEEAKKKTDKQEAQIEQYKREITNLEKDIANQKKEQQSAIAKKKKLRQAAKKLNEKLAVIAASNALDAAQQATRAKDKLKQVKAQIKEAEAKEKTANGNVRRLKNEQSRVRMEIENEQEALNEFRDELDVRDADIYNEEKQLQIRNLNQMVYVTRKQVLNVMEQIMFSHPVSVKGPRANMIARGGTYEGYALLCENTADVVAMNNTIMATIKTTGVFMEEGVEVFAFAESAMEYMSSMMDLMQDLTDKANRAATASKGLGTGIKIAPYQAVAFALAVRDHYATMKEESREIARLMGTLLPAEDDNFGKSRVAKFIANAEDKSGTTTDGLLERIANAKQADDMGGIELRWDKDTNAQYNEVIGEVDLQTALGEIVDEEVVPTPSVGFVASPADPTAAARIGGDYALPALQEKYDKLKDAEKLERDRLAGIMATPKDRIKKLKLGEFAGKAMSTASELLAERSNILNIDERIKANPGKRKKR